MKVVVNGKPLEAPDGASVEAVVELATSPAARAACAVEVNRVLVPRARRPVTPVKPGDVVEIVTLVGGG
jgi:thiazole synthase